jgi:RNA polymerase sigma-70 factor (ECF subfamily)
MKAILPSEVSLFVLEDPDIVDNHSLYKQGGPRERNDQILVSAARDGDATAFVELCNRHSRPILHRLYRITRNWEDAEDLLQESFLKAFTHLKTFEGRSSFSSWLTSIAINAALMSLRRKRTRREVSIDGVNDDPYARQHWEPRDPSDSPEVHCERRQREEMLQDAILRLRPKFRHVVELQHIQDRSTKEIAQTLGISVAAVKSRLSRARTALREAVSLDSQYANC